MRRRRSSIFSSDTLALAGTPSNWWASLALALLLVTGAELGVRALLGPGLAAPDYWDEAAGEKYEWYRARENAPRVLVIGDSSAARNFAPAVMEETLGGLDAFNLATPGNFPLALSETAYRMLERDSVPDVVVLSQAIHSFYDSELVSGREALIRGSRAARYFNDSRDATDYVALARAYDHRARVVARLRGREPPTPSPPEKGFMPHKRTGVPMLVPDGYFSDVPASDERLDTLVQLAQLATERGFRLIVAPPVQLDVPAQPRIEAHRRWLAGNAERLGFAVLDMSSVTPLGHEDFSDIFHLTRAGAEKQSRALGEVLSQCLPRDDWRTCLSDREPNHVDLVDGPRWIPEASD